MTNDVMTDEYDSVCVNCHAAIPKSIHGMLVGCLGIVLYGGYGWFFDDASLYPDRTVRLLCHDCAVLLCRLLPGLAALLGGHGRHPWVGSDRPCCEWGWQMLFDEQGEPATLRFGNGTSEPVSAYERERKAAVEALRVLTELARKKQRAADEHEQFWRDWNYRHPEFPD
jgi:hypothetical protein